MKVEILQQKGHHFLWIDDYLWMWDVPIEREAQRGIAKRAYGNVLIAGYGLGLVQQYCLENPKVTSVLTFEKNAEVIQACLKTFGKIYGTYAIEDFYFHPFHHFHHKFDCIIGDIWEDIVPESLEAYKAFKKKAESPYLLKSGGLVLAWGQEFFEYLLAKEGAELCSQCS